MEFRRKLNDMRPSENEQQENKKNTKEIFNKGNNESVKSICDVKRI
jgi:hypothetical protein